MLYLCLTPFVVPPCHLLLLRAPSEAAVCHLQIANLRCAMPLAILGPALPLAMLLDDRFWSLPTLCLEATLAWRRVSLRTRQATNARRQRGRPVARSRLAASAQRQRQRFSLLSQNGNESPHARHVSERALRARNVPEQRSVHDVCRTGHLCEQMGALCTMCVRTSAPCKTCVRTIAPCTLHRIKTWGFAMATGTILVKLFGLNCNRRPAQPCDRPNRAM